MSYYWWFLVSLLLFIIEVLTPGFVVMWFGMGAFVVAILDLFGLHDIVWQASIFAIVSFLLVIFTRRIFMNFMNARTAGGELKSQVQSLIGKTGIVTLTIDNSQSQGRILIEGQDWSARSQSGDIIQIEEKVNVVSVESAKLLVIKENSH